VRHGRPPELRGHGVLRELHHGRRIAEGRRRRGRRIAAAGATATPTKTTTASVAPQGGTTP
jgi:hypothetical protein